MLALSIRQPWSELILRGVKKIEYRSRPTRLIGERFYIYAAKGKGTEARRHGATKGRKIPVWSRDLALACDGAYEWHLAKVMRLSRPMPPARHPQPSWFEPFTKAA